MNRTRIATRFRTLGPRLPIAAARTLVALAAISLGTGSLAAAEPIVPERPLATAFATSGHAAFPLLAPDARGEVRIPTAELADGAAHCYTVMVRDLPIEFFAIWTEDNVIRTAFNACDVCFPAKLGYRRDGTFMVCNNCGNRFPIGRIGAATGGCNPAPLAAWIEAQDLVIAVSALEAGLTYFPTS